MASKRASIPAKCLFNGFRRQQRPSQSRSMATTTTTSTSDPEATLSSAYLDAHMDSAPTQPILQDRPISAIPPKGAVPPPHRQPQPPRPTNPFLRTTTTTLHAFPSLEPTRFATYPSTHLLVPLRKDILHRAIIYEADATRQGTASTKWRSEVHGSNRKVRPQKGTGRARLGDKKSPMLRGGGVAFGPKPRDFSSGLNGKVYDLAWRIALSHRYRRGELVVVDGGIDLEGVAQHSRGRFLREVLRANRMGHGEGRTLFVTMETREGLVDAMEAEGLNLGREARVREVGDVDVKDLLSLGRVVVEKEALDYVLKERQSDLGPELRLSAWRGRGLLGV